MDFQKLLQNKKLLMMIGIGIGVLVLIIILSVAFQPKKDKNVDPAETTKIEVGQMELLTTDSLGKVIELEALLSKHGIKTTRLSNGSKISLMLGKETTLKQRDSALLLIVESGLVDSNIGLEIFDKGDFTSTKDDKRIRLARAINGELSRLIRKIDPIENASVFISIPEPTMFASMQKPTTATVQLVMPVGEKLSKDKVKAITNLLLGSISGLEIDNVSITDTNGNVYSSMANAGDDSLDKIAENDEYMKAKVQTQLDKLLGKGNYVVTVSTYLRQVPVERSSVIYDPNRNVVLSEQQFNENLGDNNNESGQVTNAVSVYLPSTLPQAANTNSNRNYSRTAQEKQYGSTKTQVSEYLKPGMIEDISIAVTIEGNALPEMITVKELKSLIAMAASPKVSPDNVEIIFSDSSRPALASDKPVKLPIPEASGNPWWAMAIVLLVLVFLGWFILSSKLSAAKANQESEIENLKKLSGMQENKLQEVNQKAQVLLAQQDKMQQSITAIQQAPQQIQQQQVPVAAIPENPNIANEVKQTFQEDEEEVAVQLKNWIESGD